MSITGAPRNIGLNVTDVEHAVSWYTSTLGLGFQERPTTEEFSPNYLYDLKEANRGGGRLLSHPHTGQHLSLMPATEPGKFNPDRPGLDHLSFAVGDLQAQVDLLAGIAEYGELIYMDEIDLTVRSVHDPDGNQLEYTAAPDVPVGAAHHLRLTVSDLGVSTRFYETLGFQVVPLPAETPLLRGGVLMAHPAGFFLGMRPAAKAQGFEVGRVGLSHLSFDVGSDEDLRSLATELAEIGCQGTTFSPGDAAGITGLRTTDPSGIPVTLITQL